MDWRSWVSVSLSRTRRYSYIHIYTIHTKPNPYLLPNPPLSLALPLLLVSTTTKAFDFDVLCDRQYNYVASTSDDGWLVGGGEPKGSPKLPAPDSAHIEVEVLGWGLGDPNTATQAAQAAI